jgi:DnaJ-class molecular chaperone
MQRTGTPAPTAPAGFTADDLCPTCHGAGQVEDTLSVIEDETPDQVECDDCDGVGWSKPAPVTETNAQLAIRRMREHFAEVHPDGDLTLGPGCRWATCAVVRAAR